MKKELRLSVNGNLYETVVEPRKTLAEVLREDLGLTGTKITCNTGNCGSCTIILDGKKANSCQLLAHKAEGKEITTIEGLAIDGRLHPLQEAFIDNFAVQCGYCTPGMILTAKVLLDQNPAPTEEEVRNALVGNLCRCTGYINIIEAVLVAADKIRQQNAYKKRDIRK